MLGKLYIVKNGDTLWDIATKQLGNPLRWPEIYAHNNNQTVIINTGIKISDPNLIFVGQKIYIPETQHPTNAPAITSPLKNVPNAGKVRARQKVHSIPFKYNLETLPTITVISPTHIATVSLKGSVTLQAMNPVDFATFTNQGFEITAKSEADHAFGKLVNETQVGYNHNTGEITFECGITSHSNHPYTPSTKAAAGISSKTGLPVIKGSITAPDLKGQIDKYFYLASSLGIEIEITPRPPTANPRPIPIPSAKPIPNRGPGWDYLLGSALVAGAGVIIVATIVEDILTLGAGVADDVPSFAAAAAMYTSGVTMFKTVNSGTPIKIEGHGIAPNQL